ncbi:uncharacterized protein LOC101860046 isoform X2 [Aplysia californica]|uniref:Uncharacterized protein LOC101860046 isoform X2 n=1 Tax=Aplysia californica TaxID=6500 RepID=A0ABM1W082_APLCA|nr:uncharacterized protein LOC101860046 isoform X2 [Aplysia californica]
MMDAPFGEEYEEMVMMVDIPTHINIGRGAQEDSFVQILGLSSDRPLVKVNNQVLAGEVITALGSDLLLEIETSTVPSANKDSQNTTIKKVKDVIVTDKRLNMDPVYLESKKRERKTPTKKNVKEKVTCCSLWEIMWPGQHHPVNQLQQQQMRTVALVR